ncbi:MAG TPA: hypothetical protein VMH00_11155 [Candidatus Limnocylindrales bacterium]|nr:hypothetical protein [Candidatus Limnocylindrales bacterium]
MDRRRFLQNLAVAAAGIKYAKSPATPPPLARTPATSSLLPASAVDVAGHAFLCEFKLNGTTWKAYDDLRTRDGSITFVSSAGTARVLPKTAEATFAEADTPYLGLSLAEIGTSGPDLLADKLLAHGDPNPEQVKAAAPPLESAVRGREGWRLPWNTFVGTKECSDTMPVFYGGATRTYHSGQYFPELNGQVAARRFEGLVGDWMPAVRKVFPVSENAFIEVIVFGDVEDSERFIVQTWHRTMLVESGKISRVVYGYSYPDFPPRRQAPAAERFYRGLLVFAEYWEKLLQDFAPTSLPENSWVDMSKHAFAKELMARPGGVYPKYGAVDRDYYGPEYDGFQDIFTMSLNANLEWGRFEPAREIIDNYLTDFTDATGMINMRGPEVAQFGMTLSLLARYYNYTLDRALLAKHAEKIAATAELLAELHEESLRLPADDPGYGLIHGWSESDSCLAPRPMTWWLPYYSHNAFASRGLKDMSSVWTEIVGPSAQDRSRVAESWLTRSRVLRDSMVAALRKNVRRDMTPPYIGTYAGAAGTFWESMKKERPSPQGWPHRGYAELLQADVLPADLANLVIDCMRAYGATTLGIVANVEPPHPQGRDILGFISYGYAQMLLRLDRIEEYLLFLYSHRYHDHTRGSWTAGEVSGITGESALFCVPAQQTIPLLVRWMLVLEDSHEDRLYFARGLPRDWLASAKEIRIRQAPTRWGRVDLTMIGKPESKQAVAALELARAGAPKELHVKFRLPAQNTLQRISVNGRPASLGGLHGDTAIFATGNDRRFELVAEFS